MLSTKHLYELMSEEQHEQRGGPKWLANQATKAQSIMTAECHKNTNEVKSLVVLDENGNPDGYYLGEWRHHGWETCFYIAIYGSRDHLRRLCDRVAQITGPDGNVYPQFIWPEFKGQCEAYITIQDDPQPWHIAEALPLSKWLPQFVEDRVTPFLADYDGPVTYAEGWKYGGELPHHFVAALSGEFPDLSFIIGGVADCGYCAVAESWEIRNQALLRSVYYDVEEFERAALPAVPGEEEPLWLENDIAEAEANRHQIEWQENNYGHPCEGCYHEYTGCYGERWTKRCSGWKPGGDDTWQLDTVPTAELESKIANAETEM